ncbi:hypothetical protein [Nostoc sp. ATCC 53789]|uniref:hypothetical protein n=1 Tax=Nostoc sp. ATCC 53789 TaxID=76335 RepID=UPI000DEC9F23|nr:hypothetical protein [Nostoc sp. ATCC 53789]QHG15795.1 hypothetical protein GJB62_07310 [Nostoc sp. ATCC 53789]RCJ27766.1 hypothetical protein A6V25_17860 [Nostoc sp. ATCC 53789]
MTGDIKTPNCINCGSQETRYDSAFGFYKCESCSTVWGNDEDDPDYDESVSCPDCWGTGLIYAYVNDSQPSKCTTCKGTGYM